MKNSFALLDDYTASASAPNSRLYTRHIESLNCTSAQKFPAMLKRMQNALGQGKYAVCLFSYELGAALQGVDHAVSTWPLAEVLLFDRCEYMSAEQVTQWLDEQQATEHMPVGTANLHANVSDHEFSEAINKIRAYIEAGDTYQVNYTYRLYCDVFGLPASVYRRLRERQPVPYGALIHLPDGRAVASLSPELFLRNKNGVLTAQPMKGTAQASGHAEIDKVRARELAEDEKNRAENLMIVDLLRNDLGRIAEFGSIKVPAMYDVNAFGGVLQMTSTITAQLRKDTTLADIFGAVYPCGSITGAPKKRTMEIIREVEPDVRGLYTGAIGWFDPPQHNAAVGNFCMSVPIRTLAMKEPDEYGIRQGEFGVGAGIVFDSVAADEYAECALKARFLTGLPQQLELFETMRVTRKGCLLIDRHLDRLCRSAKYFGFAFEEQTIRTVVNEACAVLPEGDFRMRLSLGENGTTVQMAPLQALTEPVRVLIADKPMQSKNLFLRHKTSVRETYDTAWRAAEAQGAFDMLFCNERSELTEGGRSNVLLKLDGQWVTPPLAAGVLPGVMRSVLMADSAWDVQERTLTLEDLHRAENIAVCNALRGVLKAVVVRGE